MKKTILFGSGVCFFGGVCLMLGWALGLATACAIEEEGPEIRLIDFANK